jgi:hypothetical protein
MNFDPVKSHVPEHAMAAHMLEAYRFDRYLQIEIPSGV